MQTSSKFYAFSWNEFDDCVDYIVQAIKSQNTNFHGVAGLPRGGLPLAVTLSHRLQIPYFDLNNKTEFKKFNKEGNNLLIVDDISDGGNTFIKLLEKINGPANITTAALLKRRGTAYTPKFVGMEILGSEWIIFPWEERIYTFDK